MPRETSLKTAIDVSRIRAACRRVERCIQALAPQVRVGVSTRALDQLADQVLRAGGAEPSLRGYRGFPGSICASVNNVAAHGVPTDAPLEEGDVLSVDITAGVDGWHGDAAWTFLVGRGSPDARRLLRAAWTACWAGVAAVKAGAYLGDVGWAIQRAASRHGCSVAEEYVGHGIGRAMHEDPVVANIGERGTGTRIVAGMVFTVEPMVTLGGGELRVEPDGWTLATADGSLAAQFEQTVAVFRDRVEVLTFAGGIPDRLDFPPTLT